MPWEEKKSVTALISKLKKDGFTIIGLEQDNRAVDYKKVKLKNKNAFLVGTEVTGIDKSIMQKCDVLAEIPMKGKKESLNVSVSLGVALFRILNL